jgi:hypothetical protein
MVIAVRHARHPPIFLRARCGARNDCASVPMEHEAGRASGKSISLALYAAELFLLLRRLASFAMKLFYLDKLSHARPE